MNEAKQALLNYKIYFRDGNEAEVLDKYHDPDFESKILNGLIPVYDNDGKSRTIGKANVDRIMPFYNTLLCATCYDRLVLHAGDNFCKHCELRTWLPVAEV